MTKSRQNGQKHEGNPDVITDTSSSNKPPPLLFSSRLALALISCVGFINLYALRVNLSVAMVCMVNQTALDEMDSNDSQTTNERPATCNGEPGDANNATADDDQDGEFAWSKGIQGLVLSSFFWGYIMSQVLGGWLAGRFGGKRVFGYSMFVCALVSLVMPISARTDYKLLMVTRMIAGLCQGVVWPSMAVLWTRWAPPKEVGKLTGICYAGAQLGNVVTFPVAGVLCEYGFDGGWSSIFYTFGLFGIVWFLAWMVIVSDSPEDHPRVSTEEREYLVTSLRDSIAARRDQPKLPTPWFAMLTSRRVWAMVVAHTCANWGTYTFLTNIPTYMKEVLYFDVKENGLLSALPYVGFGAAISISGALYDWVVTSGLMSKTVARKTGNTLGMLVPGVFIIGVGFMDCTRPALAVALLVVGVAMSGFRYGAGSHLYPADIAPSFAGVIFGISNTFATLPGILAPTVIGLITTDQTQKEWQVVFLICAAIYSFGALFFIVFAQAEIQPWALPPQEIDVKDLEISMSDEKKNDSLNTKF